jgi:hypothetical protein
VISGKIQEEIIKGTKEGTKLRHWTKGIKLKVWKALN